MAESREQLAQREVGHTDIAPWLSRIMTAVFLMTILVVPALQTVHDIRQGRTGDRSSAVPQLCQAAALFGSSSVIRLNCSAARAGRRACR